MCIYLQYFQASDSSSAQDSKPGSPATSTPTSSNVQDNGVKMKQETRKDSAKREVLDTSQANAKKSKIEDEEVEMIEDEDDDGDDEEKQEVAPKSTAKTTSKTQDEDVQMIDEDTNPEEASPGKGRWMDGGNKPPNERLLKALTQSQ